MVDDSNAQEDDHQELAQGPGRVPAVHYPGQAPAAGPGPLSDLENKENTMFRPALSLAALLAVSVLIAGEPGVRTAPEPPPAPVAQEVPVVQEIPVVQEVPQTITMEVPETYYEMETRTRKVPITRMVPVTEEVDQTYQVRVPKTRMVTKTFQICPTCAPSPGPSTVDAQSPGPDIGRRVGCLQRLRDRRLARMGRYDE